MKSSRIIDALISLGESLDSPAQKQTIMNAVLEITRLNDENQSVWDILEEIKKSDIRNYQTMLSTKTAFKILDNVSRARGTEEDGKN